MSERATAPPSVAVIGAGMSGAGCAAALHGAGLRVELFERADAVGGRMASRSQRWVDAQGRSQAVEFDLGVLHFVAHQARFRAMLGRAQAAGAAQAWSPRLHSSRPGVGRQDGWVGAPDMAALVRYLTDGLSVRTGHTVQRLHRCRGRGAPRWEVVTAEAGVAGRFDAVVIALPPPLAAPLLAGLHDDWADALASRTMAPCWTLLAVSDEVDWCWDAAEIDTGPLGWIARQDRKPGRSAPPGLATWVAHATTSWSTACLERDPDAVCEHLQAALERQVPGRSVGRWHHASVQRWRHAVPALRRSAVDDDCWWDPTDRKSVV